MRILFISSWWPTRVHPAHGNFIQKHARLVGRRHDVTVIAIQEDTRLGPTEIEAKDVSHNGYREIIIYYGRPSCSLSIVHPMLRARAYWAGLRQLRGGGRIMRPDVIHGHILIDGGIAAALVGRWWNRPVVITEHANFWNTARLVGSVKYRLAVWACKQASVLLPVSRQLGQNMRTLHALPGKYHAISNVVDDSLFSSKTHSAIRHRPFRLLHISNFDPRFKNVAGLLRVYASLSRAYPERFHLTVAGDGDLEVVQKWTKEAGLTNEDVTLLGDQSEMGVAHLMKNADVFVLFSDDENQPVVLLEAQCCGLPCIATRVGGIGDIIVEGQTGYLVRAGDEIGLKKAVIATFDNYWLFNRQAISERAKRLYGEETVAAALERVYSRA